MAKKQAYVSALGLTATLIAAPSYPQGIILSEFADNGDSLSSPDIEVNITSTGVNGTPIVAKVPQPVDIEINLIPGTRECEDMENLFKLNLAQGDKESVNDVLTLTINHPTGKVSILTNGVIVGGSVIQGYGADRKAKTRTFRMRFWNTIN